MVHFTEKIRIGKARKYETSSFLNRVHSIFFPTSSSGSKGMLITDTYEIPHLTMEISMMWRCNEKTMRVQTHTTNRNGTGLIVLSKYTKWVILHKIGVISQSSHLTKWLVLKPVYDDGYPNSLLKKRRWIQMPALEIPPMSRSEAGCLVASSTLRCKSL